MIKRIKYGVKNINYVSLLDYDPETIKNNKKNKIKKKKFFKFKFFTDSKYNGGIEPHSR